MWVKNQDGIAVVEVQALALDPSELVSEEKRKNGVRVWGSINDHDFVMGVYKTVEEAIAVLKDFYHAINLGNKTYNMPPRGANEKDIQ